MWQGLRVDDLKPLPDLSESTGFTTNDQNEVIADLQAYPFSGHSFFGSSGTGKSRFLSCLLQEAILADKDVFYSKMSALIRAIRDNEFGRLPEERWGEIIDADDLRARDHGRPLYIFLDEIDKIPITDEVFLKVLELFDFIYENSDSAVISVCSNLSPESCEGIWGVAVTRRILALTHVHILACGEGE
jgi:DNA replication protein DnaC